MSEIIITEKNTTSIRWCINCTGYHPNELPTMTDLIQRSTNPQKEIWRKHLQFEKKKFLYMNRVCVLCGRSYDRNGRSDETFKATAKIVADEFAAAGISGLDDKTIEAVVAQCRKAFMTLIANRKHINPYMWKTLTFSGQLEIILNEACDAKDKKKALKQSIKLK